MDCFVPCHTNILSPEVVKQDGGFVFSAGRSLCDYKTLVESHRGTGTNVIIVCGNADLKDVDLPANGSIKREIKREDYLALLMSASFVVVPLVVASRSTSHVAIFEAMSFDKAVVTADYQGTQEAIGYISLPKCHREPLYGSAC
jgi:glycosyltransferase involved in cell wall biosynthesis